MNKTLVLFDFDGTLTKRDTFPQFVFFSQGYLKGMVGFVIHSPVLFLFLFKRIDGSVLKEKLVSFYFKKQNEDALKLKGKRFIEHLFTKKGFNGEVLGKLKMHRERGEETAVVSASLDIWIKPFCEQNNIKFICTELEYINGECTGKLKTPNCNRGEKAVRIKAAYNLNDYDKVIAYGNGSGDKEMFTLAHEAHLIK